MKALVYHGPGRKSWDEVPDPVIQHPTDVIVRMVATTICGTDLHILKGDTPEVEPGRILGHEGIGEVTEIGSGVTQLHVGDRVILSCISACGNCRQGLYSHCLNPEGILVSGVLPTGFEIGVQYGRVQPGDVVAVIGAGPVGLSAVMTSQLYGPSRVVAVDLDDARLARAKEFGATDTVNSGQADWAERVLALTDGDGVDVAIEAVGTPGTFTMAVNLVRPGGHVANIGVHGKPVELALNDLWIRNIDIAMGLVNTNTTSMLLKLVAQHRLPVDKFVTHEFSFDRIEEAYEVFGNAAEHDALKVLIH